jgi:HEAT repeat protein
VAAARTWSRKIDRKRLEKMILDPDPGVRVEAAAGLGRFEGEKTARILAQTARLDPDPKVRARAVVQVKSLGTGAMDVCRSALNDENMGVRNAALRGLCELGSDEAVELIRDRMAGPMTEVTVVAAAELARLGHKDGKSRFFEALKNRRSNIRATALTHLDRARIEDPGKIRLRMLDDEAPSVVLTAAAALLTGADPKGPVASALRRIVKEGSMRAQSARDMLAVIGDPVAVAEVEEVLEQGDEKEVTTSLKRVARAAMLYNSFVSLLKDDRAKVRIEAARGVLMSSPT